MRGPRFTKEDLVNYVIKFKEENSRLPERRDFLHNPLYPSSSQYIREWGSWGRAIMHITGRTTSKEKKRLNKFKCIQCGTEFEAYNIRRKFCSINCRDTYNLINLRPIGYRATAFKTYPWRCEICGYDECTNYLYGKGNLGYPTILDVHHIDGNRRNGDYRNLCILCPTCHAKVGRGIIINVMRNNPPFLKLSWDIMSVDDYLDLVSVRNKERSKKYWDNKKAKREGNYACNDKGTNICMAKPNLKNF